MPTIPSNRLKPFMAYLEDAKYVQLKRFSKQAKIPMSQLIREAIDLRISPGDKYVTGFNDGLIAAMKAVSANEAAQMRFPSGRSFADLVNEQIEAQRMAEVTEGSN
jgi:hypothetical protein